MKALCSAQETGILEYLSKNTGGVSGEDIASNLSLDRNIVESLMDFLVVNLPEFFDKNESS